MHYAGLFHACRKPWVYPVDDQQLRVVLMAARGDLAAATCLTNDRYTFEFEQDEMIPMERLGDDGFHEYWSAVLPGPSRRVRYIIHVQGTDGNCAWLTGRGIVANHLREGKFFEYPYLHRGDAFRQPPWIRDAVFYGIYPDRFCNGDPTNDPPETVAWEGNPIPDVPAGGDLAGIRQRLGYLKELGVTAICSTPLFRAPSPHKYDTADYYQIDPAFGTNAEFKALVAEAHEQSIRFLLDGVFNHCGAEFFAFKDLVKSGRRSEYKRWFYEIQSYPVRVESCNYETFACQANMPKLDTTNPDVADYLLKVAEHWTNEAGIDGWRLGVANEVDHGFWRGFRQRVKRVNPEVYVAGDNWSEASDWLQGDQFDGVMNHTWRDLTVDFLCGRISALDYDRALTRNRFAQTAEVARGMINFLTTHDHSRIRSEVGSREKAAQAAVLMMTAEGVPMVYYGDEIGMEGEGFHCGARGCYPWGDESQQDLDLLALYRRLIWVRRAFPWLNDGGWQTHVAEPVTGLYCFKRTPTPATVPNRDSDEPGIHVVINNSARPLKMPLPMNGNPIDLLAGHLISGEISGKFLHLPPHGAALLAPKALPARIRE